ncbi:hypothetical protein [Microcystis aeruginosa]|uniref:hypothetical protein n=1 Tax=Microcystis aeruginosa TaxID=1126 RepID=UPI00187CC053|nr:hypothetical protein [Microcystis aeruginosa]
MAPVLNKPTGKNLLSIGGIIENLGLKPRRFTAALPLNTSAFRRYILECEAWKKPIRFDFTPHQHKSRYCGAHWAV